MKRLLRIATSLLIVYVALVAILFFLQRNIVFAPSTQRVEPASAGLSAVEVIELSDTAGNVLYNWYARAQPGRPTLLYFHGNGGAIHHRAYKIHQYQEIGFGVFIVGYPGYGGSGGQPTEATLVEAALRAYDYLAPDLGVDKLVIYGESLGSAVATQLAAQRSAKALVLAAPMYSIEQIAAQQYPFVPARMLIKDKFRSFQHIDKIDMPLLVVHGSDDGLIPINSGQALFDVALEPKRFVRLDGARHNNLYDFPIVETVSGFIGGLDSSKY